MNCSEPFTNLLTQGMVKLDGATMSKSRGNVVAPEDMIAKYGCDALRAYILFMAPPDKDLDWSYEGLEGMYRWIGRVWRLVVEGAGAGELNVTPGDGGASESASAQGRTLVREMHRVIGKVTDDIGRFQFNTAIAAMMELTNAAYDYRNAVPEAERDAALLREVSETITLLLAPFAPHMCEELWRDVFGHEESVHLQAWPVADAKLAAADVVELAIQVNGKVRGRISVDATAPEQAVKDAALAEVADALGGTQPKKVIVVPGRLVNIVVAG